MKHLVTLLIILIAGASAPAHAQPADAGKITVARRLYDEGVDAVGQGRWSVAHDRFKGSYDLSPRVLTLFNLAGAQAQTSRVVEASESYRRFLRETQDGRYVELRSEATAALDELEKQVAQLSLRLTGLAPSDVITVDDTEIPQSTLSEAFPMNPGVHVIAVRRNGAAIRTKQITLGSGVAETATLDVPVAKIDLQARNIDEPAVTGAAFDARPAPKTETSNSLLRSPWFWGAVVLVAAGGAAGAYIYTRPDDGVLVVR